MATFQKKNLTQRYRGASLEQSVNLAHFTNKLQLEIC